MPLVMTTPSVFYSWQSDLPRGSTRDVVRDAALAALSQLANRFPLQDSPRIDHDTLGEAGTPTIAESIYRKIENSAVFIADVTIVGSLTLTKSARPKRLSNPNVLIELGYAAARIGWDRVILVMNKHYGSPESLPFDLQSRRFPITFDLGPESVKRDFAVNALTLDLERVIGTCLAAEYDRVDHILASLSSYARSLIANNGGGTHFWETKSENTLLSRLDLAIGQLLEHEVIRYVDAATESGLAYAWTYLGRQCAQKLGILPLKSQGTSTVDSADTVLVDLSAYDALAQKTPDGTHAESPEPPGTP